MKIKVLKSELQKNFTERSKNIDQFLSEHQI
jgi:hypothetical protein